MPVLESKNNKPENKRGRATGVKAAPRVDEMLMEPGDYEVRSDSTFDVEIHLKAQGNRWIVVGSAGKDVVTETIKMRLWNYNEMVDLRKKATAYDASKRMHMVDNDVLNRLKVQKLMVSWTFGEDNARLKIIHVGGVLTDESWDAFTKLQPNIISHIMSEMNNVYELGL